MSFETDWVMRVLVERGRLEAVQLEDGRTAYVIADAGTSYGMTPDGNACGEEGAS